MPVRINLLKLTLSLSILGLSVGLAVVLVDLEKYAFGLYMILLSFVGFIISVIWIIVGPDNANETIAEKFIRKISRSAVNVANNPMIVNNSIHNLNNHVGAGVNSSRWSNDDQNPTPEKSEASLILENANRRQVTFAEGNESSSPTDDHRQYSLDGFPSSCAGNSQPVALTPDEDDVIYV